MNDPKATHLIVDILGTDCRTVMRGVRQRADQLILQLLTLEEVEA